MAGFWMNKRLEFGEAVLKEQYCGIRFSSWDTKCGSLNFRIRTAVFNE